MLFTESQLNNQHDVPEAGSSSAEVIYLRQYSKLDDAVSDVEIVITDNERNGPGSICQVSGICIV